MTTYSTGLLCCGVNLGSLTGSKLTTAYSNHREKVTAAANNLCVALHEAQNLLPRLNNSPATRYTRHKRNRASSTMWYQLRTAQE